MGIDFIRAASGKPYVKRWAKGHERARTPGLFDIQFGAETKIVTAALSSEAQPGTKVILQRCGTEVMVFEGLKSVGKLLDPPASVSAALDASHGLTPGVIDRVGGLGHTAEISF
ncbi:MULTISPECIES: hypothetical protein [Brevundimonas]|uniref:Uncharacterized protein n=1 Tax=Brevundimonas abyssalis TAR-001 TaxID=1391729 RepID=A0A8E0KIY7_9CAUL|nr:MULTISPECIES: hypothetical protein [Brevundimonas]GAD58601.1 hypothetical protein MBEBAB_0851 [Brevundimonas abyssalis TAR-001]